MRALLPYLTLYRRHGGQLALGVALAIVTLLASIGLLTLSGWFLAGAAITRTAGAAPAASVALSASRVRFRYPGQAAPAIDELSLTVAAGEHIALLGIPRRATSRSTACRCGSGAKARYTR